MSALVARLAASPPLTAVTVALIAGLAIAVALRVFGLTIAGALALYFLCWWILLFTILPFGRDARPDDPASQEIAGADPGAPPLPRLAEKAIWTTIVASLVYIVVITLLPLAGL